MILPPFEGSKRKIARANKHIAELESLVADFASKVVLNFEREDQGENWLWLPRFSMPPPPDVPLIMGDAVHNLRTALDVMICDLARLRGANTRTRLDYPFEENELKLDEKLSGPKSKYKRLGPDIHAAIKSTKPYKEKGSIGLRGLHELDMWDKHEIILPTYLVARARMPVMEHIAKMTGHPLMKMLARGGYYPVHEDSKLSLRKDLDPTKELDFSISKPTPQLPPGLPFAEKPILEVLNGLSKMTTQIVSHFETKFGSGNPVAQGPPSGDNGDVQGG
jgi:hypothetical protein